MSTKITLKKSSVTGKIPLVNDVDYGEIALNYNDGLLFYKTNLNEIDSVGVDWDNIHNNPATDTGTNLYTLPNPDAISFLRVNADNSVTALDNDAFRTAIGTETTITGSAIIPAGTEAERDASPFDGFFRYNTDTKHYEGYSDGEWIPFAEHHEIEYTSPDLGTYVIDTFPAELFRSAKYDIQMSATGGYHSSEVKIIHDTGEADYVEYGKVISAENLGYFEANYVGTNVEVSCDFIYPGTVVIFTRSFKTNTGDTYIGNDMNEGSGAIDCNEGFITMDLNN